MRRAARHRRYHLGGIAALLAAIVLVVAGCSSPDEDGGGAPVKINLPDGRSVTVDGTPKRIVTLGGQWTDVALTFGVKPVGYFDSLQMQTKSPPPWYGDKLNGSEFITLGDDVVAKIAALKPDLILAPGFAAQSGEMDKLTKLAPTIDKISGQEVDPWEDMVRLMGTILHKPDRANEIISNTNGKVDAIKKDYPGLEGKTYSFAFMFGADQIQVLGNDNDGAGKTFSALGMSVAPRLAAQAKKDNLVRFPISTENVPMLNANLVVISAQTADLQKRLEGLPGYRGLPAVRKGAVSMLTFAQVTGLNEPSPTSIPYVLDSMRPAFEAASR